MKFTYSLITFFCLLPFLTFAQQKVEIGGFAGVANYQGDLADDQIEIGETKLAFGGYVSYFVNPKFILRGNVFYGEISGNDLNSVNLQARGWSYRGDIFEVGANGQWLILGKSRYNNAGIFTPQFTPFLFTGVNIALVDGDLSFVNADDADRFPEVLNTNNFISIPLGAGFRFDVSENFAVGFEGGFRTVFSDYLDNVSVNANPDKNDWYIFTGLTLSYIIGSADNFKF